MIFARVQQSDPWSDLNTIKYGFFIYLITFAATCETYCLKVFIKLRMSASLIKKCQIYVSCCDEHEHALLYTSSNISNLTWLPKSFMSVFHIVALCYIIFLFN